jgi:hypothetical protein
MDDDDDDDDKDMTIAVASQDDTLMEQDHEVDDTTAQVQQLNIQHNVNPDSGSNGAGTETC